MATQTYRDPTTGNIYDDQGRHIESLRDYQARVASGELSGNPLAVEKSTWWGPLQARLKQMAGEKKTPVGSINTTDAASTLNQTKTKFDSYSTQTRDPNAGANATTGIPTGQDNQTIGSNNTGSFSLEEAMQIFGNDFTGLNQQPNGRYIPDESALARIGITGVNTNQGQNLQSDVNNLDNQLLGLANNLQNYNVDTDPLYQAEATNIRNQYQRMRDEMKVINDQREKALKTLGYRTGTTQYAGSVQMGILGEELSQADQRLSDINNRESAALTAARKAYKDEKYTEFSKQVDALDKIRDNKADALKNYNQALVDANKKMTDNAKYNLDVLNYQLKLKESGQTTDTNEYNLAKQEGFDGTFLDYQLTKQQMGNSAPASYKEWQLAGGQDGTGKTYAEFIAQDYKGPASYQEWNLAGGQQGTGKSYAEWVAKDKSIDSSTLTKVMTIANQFDGEQAIKNYQVSAEAIDAIKRAGNTPTDDISRVYAFAKVMDPNSVVREGEYDTVQKYAQAVLQAYGLKGKRIFENSGFLTQEARNFLLTTLNNRLKSSEKAFDNIYSEYGRRINKITGQTDGTDYISNYKQAFGTKDLTPMEKFDDWYVNTAPHKDLPQIEKKPNDTRLGATEEERKASIMEYYKVSFNQVGGDTNKASDKTAMRTDRHNNPTAFTTDIAKAAGLKEGIDYTTGDPFGGGKYKTAKLLGNPVDTTIKVIDKIGFYTQGGKQRWTHTAISQSKWGKMSYEQKKDVIKQLYQKEGNKGALNQYFG